MWSARRSEQICGDAATDIATSYGKTTLMEYVANRLGIIFMKINGPAIGHHVTSLDPTEAPNAGAREEVEKLNLALEMGDNVMLYLDDIQHTAIPSFCKSSFRCVTMQTRKIEGVSNGKYANLRPSRT